MSDITRLEEVSDKETFERQLTSYDWGGIAGYYGIQAFFDGSEPIKVTVGAEANQRTWYLPKKILTHCSPFFDSALNGTFTEASSKAVDLPEDDPGAFEIWVLWLSLGKCNGVFNYSDFDHAYVRAWVFGDKLVCPAFKDHVMFQFLVWCEHEANVWPDTIRVVYKESPPGCKLRRLFVDWFAWDKGNGWLSKCKDEAIALTDLPEFLKDVLRAELEADKETIPTPWEHKHRYYENPAFKPDDEMGERCY